MSDYLFYYAYGSNLHPARLRARIPSSQLLGPALLQGYQLLFHKRGGDHSAKCNAQFTGNQQHQLRGALFRLLAEEKPILDEVEGRGYRVESLSVSLAGQMHSAFAYIAETDFIDHQLKPYHWYKELVQLGAQYHAFPADYIEQIVNVESIQDEDLARHRKNEQILAQMR